MKAMHATYDEMIKKIKAAFDGYEVEKTTGSSWKKIRISKAGSTGAAVPFSLTVYSYSKKLKDDTEKCVWYFSFYSIWRSEGIETMISETPGFLEVYKEGFEKAEELQDLLKAATKSLIEIDEETIRNWKLSKLLEKNPTL
jgi:hypothetical protein